MKKIILFALSILMVGIMLPVQAGEFKNYFVRKTDAPITVYYKVCKNGDNCENAVPLTLEKKDVKYEADAIPYEKNAGIQLIKIVNQNQESIKEGDSNGCSIRNNKDTRSQAIMQFEGEAVKGKISCAVS